ncbi:MAG: excinuclease ABC subunit UvrC [Lachnospiraceae bacterium]|nr:excinuclease ABC subunit UvrC [Lachnospiraceae bacterium]
MREFDIKAELAKLPSCPGVYIMHDARDRILYVGKAKVLKRRVSQYFREGSKLSPKIRRMVSQVNWFEYIVVATELESLVLENNLIKENRPPYNTLLKDDKTYPFIKVTVDEPYPRVFLTRIREKDKGRYFGPFTNGVSVNDTIELLRKIYHIRTCNRALPSTDPSLRPCLYHQIGQCDAPCVGGVSEEDYGAMVAKVLKFLGGDYTDGIAYLTTRMEEASADLQFEKAAEFRDLITRVKALSQVQHASDTHLDERDIIGLAREEEHCVVQIFFERNGRIIGREHFHMQETDEREDAEILSAFLRQFYEGTPYIPREVMTEAEPEDAELLEQWLSTKRGQPVHIRVPKIGGKERLVRLAKDNARMVIAKDLEKITREEARTTGAMNALGDLLGLPGIHRVESYDISNISGFHSVGSMVVFTDGRPRKSDYRKFRIQSVDGPDDYASMREVLTRRFLHGLREQENEAEMMAETAGEDSAAVGRNSFSVFPDVILMDGGKGQIEVAEEVLAELGIKIPVCGMVKDDRHRTRGLYFRGTELALSGASRGEDGASSEVAALVTRIQDETHRFAIEYHRSLRSKGQTRSILDDIPGIGPTRRRALMKYYKGMTELREATEAEIAGVPGMNKAAAASVYAFLHHEDK